MGVGERGSGSRIIKSILRAPRNHSLRKRRVVKRKLTLAWSKQRWHHSGSQRHGSETKGHNFFGPYFLRAIMT